jgi:hypothetical protein
MTSVTALDLGYDSTTTDLDRRYQAAGSPPRLREPVDADDRLRPRPPVGQRRRDRPRLRRRRPFDDRVTITDNRMRPSTRTNVARLTKTDPMWIGIPKDRTDSEIQRARIRGDVYEHYWRELEAARRLRLVVWYRETTGNGFWKMTWDQTAGDAARYVGVKGQGILADPHGRPVTP